MIGFNEMAKDLSEVMEDDEIVQCAGLLQIF